MTDHMYNQIYECEPEALEDDLPNHDNHKYCQGCNHYLPGHFSNCPAQAVENRDAPAYVTWKQRDGTPIQVRHMDDKHLYYAIKMLERRAERAAKNANYTGDEQMRTGLDMLSGKVVYHAMVKVAEARGIDLTHTEPLPPKRHYDHAGNRRVQRRVARA